MFSLNAVQAIFLFLVHDHALCIDFVGSLAFLLSRLGVATVSGSPQSGPKQQQSWREKSNLELWMPLYTRS